MKVEMSMLRNMKKNNLLMKPLQKKNQQKEIEAEMYQF